MEGVKAEAQEKNNEQKPKNDAIATLAGMDLGIVRHNINVRTELGLLVPPVEAGLHKWEGQKQNVSVQFFYVLPIENFESFNRAELYFFRAHVCWKTAI